jgi:hypothetical protein
VYRIIAVTVVLTLVVPATTSAKMQFDVDIVESGPSLGPGEDSVDLALDTHRNGDHYLVSGYGHAGEFRVLDRDLETLTVVGPPEEGYVIKGCTFSDWDVRLLVWGRAQGEVRDTLHIYDVNGSAYGDDIVPNGTVPLVDIDQARLLASELILLVAGRDANGTSKVLFIETQTNNVISQGVVPDGRRVVHTEENGNHIPVLDEEGGLLVFESFNWSLYMQLQLLDSAPTVYELHGGRFWTLGTQDGQIIFGMSYMGGFTSQHNLTMGPVEGAVWNRRPNDAIFAVTARQGEGSGSLLEVWWATPETWPLIHKMPTEKGVEFIHHVPGEADLFLIGYEDGSIVQYHIDIQEVPPEDTDPFYKEGKYMVPLAIVVAVVLLLAWRYAGGRGQDPG